MEHQKRCGYSASFIRIHGRMCVTALFVKHIWSSLFFELFYVRFPCGLYFSSTFPLFNHFSYISLSYFQFKEGAEEVVSDIQVVIGIYYIAEINPILVNCLN